MPMMDFNNKATWDYLYNPPFERNNMREILGDDSLDAQALRSSLETLGMKSNHAIALIGGGYGWVAEAWALAGYSSIVVCDTSTYIQTNKSQHARVPILNEDGMSPGSQGRIRAALSRTSIDWVITEDVLPCLSDQELNGFLPVMRSLGSKVAHWVSVKMEGNYAPLNWKTLEEWKTVCGNDWVIERNRGARVL